jgi:hypothetical protein
MNKGVAFLSVLIVSLLVPGLFSAAGFGGGQIQAGEQTADDVSFTLTSGWYPKPVQAGPEVKGHYVLMRGGVPYCELYISGRALAASETLDQAFQQGLKTLKPGLPYYQARGTQKTKIAGTDAIVHEMSYNPSAGVPFVARAYCLIANASVYTFFFNTTSTYFVSLQGSFQQIMSTVRITELPAALPPPLPEPEPAGAAASAYRDPQGRFQIPVPPGWTTEPGGVVFRFRKGDFLLKLVVQEAIADQEEAAQHWISQAREGLTGMERWLDPELNLGFPKARRADSWSFSGVQNGVKMKFYVLSSSDGKSSYVMVFSAPAEGWDTYGKDWRKFVHGFTMCRAPGSNCSAPGGAEEKKIKTDSGPERQTKMLPEPVMIRFINSKEGVVLDTKTNLMWATKDNGSGISWTNAKSYCDNYRGGGYTDWRMPTQDELAELYASGAHKHKIKLTSFFPWASETRGSEAAVFLFNYGKRSWGLQSGDSIYRALPVRSGK